jgi:hypothetical protein
MGLVRNIDELVKRKRSAGAKKEAEDREEAKRLKEIGLKIKKKLKKAIF